MKHAIASLSLIFFSLLSLAVTSADEETAYFPEREVLLEASEYHQLPEFPADDSALTRGEAVQVLFDYFSIPVNGKYKEAGSFGSDAIVFLDLWPVHNAFAEVMTLCDYEVISCEPESAFRPDAPVVVPEFFKMFYELKYLKEGTGYIKSKYNVKNTPWYYPYIVEAKKRGLIDQQRSLGEMERKEIFEIFYRDAVLELHHDQVASYFPGLVLASNEINEDRYHSIAQLQGIIGEYNKYLLYFSMMEKYVVAEADRDDMEKALNIMAAKKKSFEELLSVIQQNPLYYDEEYSDDEKELFAELGIKEVIGEGYYDFANNAAYRKHNVRATLKNMNGLVLQPGEEFNYWKVMNERGLGEVRNGWVILGGQEVWAWGGGLCGTATAIFRSAWHAGLDITERHPHTIYYRGLYSMDDIGLDAAVYSTSPNLRFVNNTGAPIMFHVKYNENKDIATLQVLGRKHYDDIEFSGPIQEGRTYIRQRTIEYKNGEETIDEVKSVYRRFS